MSYKKPYSERSEEDKERLRENTRRWRKSHLETAAKGQRLHRQRLKVEVLTHYGSGKLACVKCGFSDVRALCLDHKNGGGVQARKNGQPAGVEFYRWLRTEGFPEGFQTLCFNCNQIKEVEEDLKRVVSKA